MRLRFALAIALFVLLASTGWAQVLLPSPQSINVVDSGTACVTAPKACAVWSIGSAPSVTFQITGTMTSMTLTFEATSDGQTWFAIMPIKQGTGVSATTTTATGQFSISNTGYLSVRARCTTYVSGNANLTLTRGTALSARAFNIGTLGATNGGTGFASYAVGDLLSADTTTSLSKIPAVASGQVLASAGTNTLPAYTGSPTFSGNVVSQGSAGYQAAAAAYFYWNGRSNLSSPANGQFNVTVQNESAGVGFNFATDALLKLRTRAQTGYASVEAAGDLTAGSQTPIANGRLQTAVYKVTVPYTDAAFIAAATDADVVIATLPAKTFVSHVLADLTTTFACTATCTTATLSAYVGKTAGGNEYLLSFDADAAAAQFGDAAAELGASLAPATVQTMIGDLGSWSATTALTVRLHSATGNIGTGAATNLSQGSATFYVVTTKMP